MITVKLKHQSAEHKFRIHVHVLYLTVCIGSMLPSKGYKVPARSTVFVTHKFTQVNNILLNILLLFKGFTVTMKLMALFCLCM